jgi:hypothetical protein
VVVSGLAVRVRQRRERRELLVDGHRVVAHLRRVRLRLLAAGGVVRLEHELPAVELVPLVEELDHPLRRVEVLQELLRQRDGDLVRRHALARRAAVVELGVEVGHARR